MSERNQGKNNEYDTGDLHTVCACGDDPASDPAFPVSEGRGRNFDARTENGHPSDTAYGSAAVAVKSYFTRFLNLFSAVILVFGEAYPNQLAGSYAGDRRHGT